MLFSVTCTALLVQSRSCRSRTGPCSATIVKRNCAKYTSTNYLKLLKMLQAIRSSQIVEKNDSELLLEMAEELGNAIINLCPDGYEVSKAKRDIDVIVEKCAQENSPEMLNLMLFRKFVGIASELKKSNGEVASLVCEVDEEKLVGVSALREKILWVRVSTCILSLISLIIMASVPKIGRRAYFPDMNVSETRN